jgi:CBS domain-containing protein
MEPSQTEIESLIIELAEKSFKTFCGDISGMFGMDMACNPKEVTYEKVDGLRTRFENFAVVFSVKSESAKGGLDGTFQMVFNREGLFILAGVVAMQPGQMILEDINSGSLEKAEKVSNVLNEVGAALAGSWDRVLRKGLDGHGRLILANTFIGNPWDKAEEKIGLNNDEELVLVPYDMTIGPYPAFKCCAIFPKTVFAGTFESGAEQPAPAEETAREDTEETSQVETEETAREDTEGTAESEGSAAGDQAQPEAEETVAADESASEKEPEAAAEQKDDDGEEEPTVTVETEEKQERPISDAIKKLTRSSVVSSDESAPSAMAEKPGLGSKEAFLDVCAKDIMQKEVVWGKPDDSVQQALSKIQQHNTEYIMIGKEQVPEGIISKSDLAGALSPYLRSIFAKWRRPLDDATLQIKIKWIMSKPTCTISPETSLAKIMENMCQMDKKCLPVVDEQGKVRGLVTVFDILRAFLKDSLPK